VAAFQAITGVNGSTPQWAYADAANLNDPNSGSTGFCSGQLSVLCNAAQGYDGPTGAGSISGQLATGAPGIGLPSFGGENDKTYTRRIAKTVASLQGGVYANGEATSCYAAYGTTTSYGQRTKTLSAGAGTAPVSLTAQLTALKPGTKHHYRRVATNSSGTSARELSSTYLRWTSHAAVLGVPALIFVAAMPEAILHSWLGSLPAHATSVLAVLAAGYVIDVTTGVDYTLAYAMGDTGIPARAAVTTAVGNLLATVALTPWLGIWGVLIGTAAAFTCGALYQVRLVHARYEIPFRLCRCRPHSARARAGPRHGARRHADRCGRRWARDTGGGCIGGRRLLRRCIRVLGGFNWSLQRLPMEGCDGQAGWLDEGVDGPRSDAVTGAARDCVADGSGGVLVGDRRRVHDDGRGRVGWSVGAGRCPVVPQRWRDARCHLRPAVGALFVV
jgi:hypothetical protein